MTGQKIELFARLFACFQQWAKEANLDVSRWTVDDHGQPVTPLGDSCSFYEAAMSLARIAEMATLHPSSVVSSFYFQAKDSDTAELPSELRKDGQPTLVVWAIWDGQKLTGDVGLPPLATPEKPAALVALEGCQPGEGSWMDPVKLYSFLEFGYRIGRFGGAAEPTSVFENLPTYDEDPPF